MVNEIKIGAGKEGYLWLSRLMVGQIRKRHMSWQAPGTATRRNADKVLSLPSCAVPLMESASVYRLGNPKDVGRVGLFLMGPAE